MERSIGTSRPDRCVGNSGDGKMEPAIRITASCRSNVVGGFLNCTLSPTDDWCNTRRHGSYHEGAWIKEELIFIPDG